MKTNSWLLAASCCFSAASAAFGPPPPSRPDGKPAKMEDFSWSDPFATQRMKKLTPICAVEKTFEAKEYLLDDLQDKPPKGLRPWQEGLKKIFKGRDYPGSWDGIDPHGYDRNLLLMEYSQVPIKVREWIEEQERSDGDGKGLFAVYEKPKDDKQSIQNVVRFPGAEMAAGLRPLDQKKIVIFAPGALYGILPLWTAEASDCKESLLDLKKYSSKPSDGAVVAWPSYTRAKRSDTERNMTFTVKAQVLKTKTQESPASKAAGDGSNGGKDEL